MLTQISSVPDRGHITEYPGGDVRKIHASLMLTRGNLPRFTPLALALATTATGASLGIAVLSAWARGGSLAERLAYTVLTGVIVSGVHLLPALSQRRPLAVRLMVAALCTAGWVVTLSGQAAFFQFAQLHAGARRAASVPGVVSVPLLANPSVRGLTAIAKGEEHARKALALLDSQRCHGSCAADHLRRTSLEAELDELYTEAAEAKRREVAEDRQAIFTDQMTRSRDAIRVDPITARLSGLTGLDEQWVNLLVGLVSAGVLDGIGAMGWYFALSARRRDGATESTSVVTTGEGGRDSVVTEVGIDDHAPAVVPDQSVDARLQQLMRDVAGGKVPVTVTGIRNHLGCAQETAAKLRRQLRELGAVTAYSNGGRHARS